MQDGFIKYLVENKKISLEVAKTIQAQFSYADYETENKINDIIELLIECELNPNTYLLEYPEILELAKIEDRAELNEILEYIREYVKKNKKKVNPYLLIHLLLASRQILEKSKKEETEMIIALLQKEGLMRIFELKVNRQKEKPEQILYADYTIVSRNIRILKKEKKYKELVYANPLLLINPNAKEVEKLLKEFQEKNNKDDKKEEDEQKEEQERQEQDKQKDVEKERNLDSDIVEDAKDNKDKESANRLKEEKDNKEIKNSEDAKVAGKPNKEEEKPQDVKIAGHSISLQEKRLLELGDEQKVLPILEAFNKYGLTYEILNNNPEILKRTKIHNIPEIIELLYLNSIPFLVIYNCPEILQKGKADEIAQVIEELKTRGISLTILVTCPHILINSTPERIRELILNIEKNNIDKYMLYSAPAILVSGDIDKYIDSMKNLDKDLTNSIDNIVQMLPNNHIAFEEVEQNLEQLQRANETKTMHISEVKNYDDIKGILVIQNINNANEILNTLDNQGIDTDIILKEPKILMKSNKSIVDLTQRVKKDKLGFNILLQDPNIVLKSDAKKIEQIVEVLKKYRPNTARKIIKSCPNLLYLGNIKNMELVFNELTKNNIDLELVDVVPQILLKQEPEEITKVISKLNERGYKKEEIINIPEILVKGKEKYIDRNFETFKRNDINIPLHLVHCISARNNEKNIDTLIEYDLDRYIEKTPEILELKNSRLMQMLEVAQRNNISVFKSVKNKETNEKDVVLNIEYFKLDDEQLSKKYELDMQYIQDLGIKCEKEEKKLRRVKNTKLYDAIYPILEKQAQKGLEYYEMDNVAYLNNGKRISKQKVGRETYLDLETKVTKEGKDVLKTLDVNKMLSDRLTKLTRNNVIKQKGEREGGRNEKN